MEFRILLMKSLDKHTFILEYKQKIIPQVGDYISINENSFFIVESRLLPNNPDSNTIVLFGNTI